MNAKHITALAPTLFISLQLYHFVLPSLPTSSIVVVPLRHSRPRLWQCTLLRTVYIAPSSKSPLQDWTSIPSCIERVALTLAPTRTQISPPRCGSVTAAPRTTRNADKATLTLCPALDLFRSWRLRLSAPRRPSFSSAATVRSVPSAPRTTLACGGPLTLCSSPARWHLDSFPPRL